MSVMKGIIFHSKLRETPLVFFNPLPPPFPIAYFSFFFLIFNVLFIMEHFWHYYSTVLQICEKKTLANGFVILLKVNLNKLLAM